MQVRSIAPQGLPDARRTQVNLGLSQVQPTAQGFGGAIGAEASNLGASIQADQQRIAEDQRQKANVAAVQDADNQLMAASTDLIYNPKSGALNVHGKDAVTLPDMVGQKFEETYGQIRNGLSNDDQKLAFERVASARRESVRTTVMAHVTNETNAYVKGTFQANLDNTMEDARLHASDPAVVGADLGHTEGAITAFATAQGMSADDTKAMIADARSKIHTVVVDQLLADGSYKNAQSYFDKFKDEIQNTGKQMEIRKALEVGNLRAQSQQLSDEILSGHTAGMIEPGNIDLDNRPQVKMPNGDIATVRSIGIEEGGTYVLIPTVSKDGTIMTNDEATAEYKKTGQFLGKFNSEESSNNFAQVLHERQARFVNGEADSGNEVSLKEALAEADKIQDPQLRDEVTARVRDRIAVNRQISNDAAAQRNATAKAILEQQYLDATNIVQATHAFDKIPPALLAKLSEPQRSALYTYAKNLSEGKKTVTNFGVYYDLVSRASVPALQDDFARIDLNSPKYLNSIDESDLKHLAEMQASIRKGDKDQTAKLNEGFLTRDQLVNNTLGMAGIDPSPKFGTEAYTQVVNFKQQVDQKIMELQQQTQKPATNKDLQGIVDGLLINGTTKVPGWFYGENDAVKHLFEVPEGKPFSVGGTAIPRDEAVSIVFALHRNNVPVTEAEIANQYRRMHPTVTAPAKGLR